MVTFLIKYSLLPFFFFITWTSIHLQNLLISSSLKPVIKPNFTWKLLTLSSGTSYKPTSPPCPRYFSSFFFAYLKPQAQVWTECWQKEDLSFKWDFIAHSSISVIRFHCSQVTLVKISSCYVCYKHYCCQKLTCQFYLQTEYLVPRYRITNSYG